jgi:hypothetical protein
MRDGLGQRYVAHLAALRESEDQLSPYDLDLPHDVQDRAGGIDVVRADGETSPCRRPQPAPRSTAIR